ncbi:MAG: SGNH hydrolase domain-containing protein [Myxococcota bacterium]
MESPFRRPQAENGHRFYWSQAAVTLFLAGLFAWGWQSGGWPERVDELTKRYARARDEMGFRPCSSRNWNCKIGRPNAVERFLVVGDSHAKHLIFGIDQFARNRGWAVRILSENGCAPLPDIVTLRRGAVRKTCEASKGNISRAVESSPARLVLLSFGYLGYRGAFADARGQALEHDDDEAFARYWTTALEGAMDRWSRPGRKFAVVLPSFRPGFDPVECLARPAIIDRRSAGARCNLGPRSELESRTRALRGAFEALAKRRDLTLLDPNDALCRGERCRIEIDRILLFSDDHHLTMKGALTVIDAFSPSLEALLR